MPGEPVRLQQIYNKIRTKIICGAAVNSYIVGMNLSRTCQQFLDIFAAAFEQIFSAFF
jgi:hypothetical protein